MGCRAEGEHGVRTRRQLDEETQCPRCAGTGVRDGFEGYRRRCSSCSGSGLLKEPKMRAMCECGERQPRWTTAFTATQWMTGHLRFHAPEDEPAEGEAV
jgi:hypothetical protein